ncbi:hypothetical protein KDL01_14335 [Actinospica durhamensis]|uniref:Uncharacterized protein n=1 Tax=Actinospica durhamensis TaxID=1508375 RepID=A0A941INX0_9ACTN|nr:hypothetical protein [Actinospica durhamensis]MBR7834449.1 hypothetical protein [Actinospica durhamensis]
MLDGQVTEIYVPGLELFTHRYLPHMLGLELIASQAYHYDREGVPRDAAELGEVARQLAAEPRWIAGGGPWFWDVHFAERAEVILIPLASSGGWYRPPEEPEKIIGRAVGRFVHRVASARRRAKAGNAEAYSNSVFDSSFVEDIPSRPRLSSTGVAVENVRAQYSEKVFLLNQNNRDQRLDSVRAR